MFDTKSVKAFARRSGDWVLSSLVVGLSICTLVTFLSTSLHAKTTYQLESGEQLSDPTEPKLRKRTVQSSKPVKATTNFVLNYIIAQGTSPRAMINGKKVVVGDYVSGAKVVAIDSSKVTISHEGKRSVLYLNKVRGIKR